jgi:hypothetical protein
VAPGPAGDALDVMATVLTGDADPELAAALRRRGLDTSVLRAARPAGTRAGTALVAGARERFDAVEPDHAQVLATAFADADPATREVATALHAAPRELAYECAHVAARRRSRGGSGTVSVLLSIVDVMGWLAAGVALVGGAVHDRAWWRIALVALFGLVQTGFGPVTRAVPVVLVWLAAGPLPGGLLLGSALTTLLLELAQRSDAFLETGIWLSIREWRSVRRWTSGHYARLMVGLHRRGAGPGGTGGHADEG